MRPTHHHPTRRPLWQRVAMTLAAMASSLCAPCQQGWPEWVACGGTEQGEQALFRRSFALAGRPQWAALTVATDGSCVAYVNGYNVATEAPPPIMPGSEAQTMVATYEVGHLLHHGCNVVALWYAPRHNGERQVAAMLHVLHEDGSVANVVTDDTWLCRNALITISPDGLEWVDGRLWQPHWSWPEAPMAGWHSVEATGAAAPQTAFATKRQGPLYTVGTTKPHAYYTDYGQSVEYHFKEQSTGWVRVTMRGMARGDTIRVGGLTYICTGTDDEQACRTFTATLNSPVTISGTGRFKLENLTVVEAIGLCIDDQMRWEDAFRPCSTLPTRQAK